MVCSLTAGQKTIVIQNKNKRNDPNRNRNATVDFTGDHPRSTHASIDRQQMTVAVARSDKGKGTGKMARYGARESRPATAGPRGAQVPAQWRPTTTSSSIVRVLASIHSRDLELIHSRRRRGRPESVLR